MKHGFEQVPPKVGIGKMANSPFSAASSHGHDGSDRDSAMPNRLIGEQA